MNTNANNPMTNRTHTPRQLERAQRTLDKADPVQRKRIDKLAAKYGITPVQVQANVNAILETPNGSSHDTCGLKPATPARLRAAEKHLAAKYGITVEQVRRGEFMAHKRLRGRGPIAHADIFGDGQQARDHRRKVNGCNTLLAGDRRRLAAVVRQVIEMHADGMAASAITAALLRKGVRI